MAPVRSFFVRIAKGDVEGVGVIHLRDHTRLVIHDHDYVAPLIHVVLSEAERSDLINALRECFSDTTPLRRNFRAPRPGRGKEHEP